jgi:glycosyltransferase involved in cell wall biosynthesis
MALKAAQKAGVPTVATFHGGGHSSRVRQMVRGVQWRVVQPLLRRAKGLVAVCQFEVEIWSQRLGIDPERIRIIRNGAEPLPVGASPPKITGSPLVCTVGRLDRLKGHHRLIEAMPALLELEPGAHLVVVGRGSYEQKLRHLAGRLHVEHAVTFTSFDQTQREELGALVRSSDVVALMSDFEAHPVAVMEAVALGRKVVVADTSGLSELAAQGLATAVPLDASPLALAEVLSRVARSADPPIPTLPTWDDCAEALVGLYGEIL